MKKIYLCPHCGRQVTRNKNKVSPGYFGTCLECNEDFYEIELIGQYKQTIIKKIKSCINQKIKNK